jgi:hypothetical protein
MKVAQYAASLSSDSLSSYRHTKNEKLRFWDNRQNNPEHGWDPPVSGDQPSWQEIKDALDLQGEPQSIRPRDKSIEIYGTELKHKVDEDWSLNGNLRIIKELLEKMTGKKIRLLALDEDAQANDPESHIHKTEPAQESQPQRQGWGLEYTYFEETEIQEGVRFSAQGNIITEKGAKLSFDVALEMSRRSYESTQIAIKAGDALIDPLVINFDGKGAELGDQSSGFDLNTDSLQENMRFLKPGSGFLALDKNDNNKIDDGSELFGPQSGNGFNDLAAYDSDQNSWIDENDPIFYALRIWEKDGQGQDIISALPQKNIGAIFLGKAQTDFTLVDSQSDPNAQLKETGLYLQETGGVGFVQEIDMVV